MHMNKAVYFFIFLSYLQLETNGEKSGRKFPDNFRFGVATASYQIEGAWNISDKGESVWDHFTHKQSHLMKENSTGDVACDSYHLYKRDVQMLVEMGVSFYRFSISWPRLLPLGYSTKISEDGLRYYNNLIDELLLYNITPMITLFHWDTPQVLQEIGGWTNDEMVDLFADYARVAFEKFGDRVKEWLTFNEPYNMCLYGYGVHKGFLVFAPHLGYHGIAEYLCGHNVLKAHAKAYHIYNNTFRATQKGKVGMAHILLWTDPESNSPEDLANAETSIQFNTGWFYHPILTKNGGYPKEMRDNIDKLSAEQGYSKSRLPEFTEEERLSLINSCDFMGVNFYTSIVLNKTTHRPTASVPSFENDMGYKFYQRDEWEQGASSWLKLHPAGLRNVLNWARREYGDMEIYITEIGYSSKGGLNDLDRIKFFNSHLEALLDAIDDGCNITAFTAWSLMDNFEWSSGYSERFGLYQVDFNSPNRTRTARTSVFVYKNIIEKKAINHSYIPHIDEYIPLELPENVGYSHIYSIIIAIILTVVVLCLGKFLWSRRRNLFDRKHDTNNVRA